MVELDRQLDLAQLQARLDRAAAMRRVQSAIVDRREALARALTADQGLGSDADRAAGGPATGGAA